MTAATYADPEEDTAVEGRSLGSIITMNSMEEFEIVVAYRYEGQEITPEMAARIRELAGVLRTSGNEWTERFLDWLDDNIGEVLYLVWQ